MKKQILLLGFIALSTVKLYAQNIAFVNERKLLAALPGYTQATKEMDSVQKVYNAEINQKATDLDQRVKSLLQNYKTDAQTTQSQLEAVLNAADKKKLTLLQEEGALLRKQVEQKQEDYNVLYQKHLAPIASRANKIIQEYCKVNKIEVLLKLDVASQTMLFYNEAKDITNILINKLK